MYVTNPPCLYFFARVRSMVERGSTFEVTVAAGKFVIDGASQPNLVLSVHPFGSAIYTFLQDDTTNTGHQLRFATVADGPHSKVGTDYASSVTIIGIPGKAGACKRCILACHNCICFRVMCSCRCLHAYRGTRDGGGWYPWDARSVLLLRQPPEDGCRSEHAEYRR